jgi:hypothetical protein
LAASVAALDALPADVDAVVSLYRCGAGQAPEKWVEPPPDHIEVWLVDSSDRRTRASASSSTAESKL